MGSVIDGIEQVDPEEAATLIGQGAFLLDVREDDEWAAGHAPGATHVPMNTVPDAHAGVLPRDNRIVVVCRSGGRSQRVAQFLQQSGYDAANLAGGMKSWHATGRAVVTDAGDDGQVI
ncbi:MAG TPA: rhodanese-like domain-containing protein [Acidimicrobiales bacterium]|jgi:rhodanese-related sulfurtransferase|nr:rhodanese-like domain-containing protein [Acidimicrobiales bacterium]